MFGYKRLCKDYDVSDDSQSYAGTFGLWTVYAAVHKKTYTRASVFVLNKKAIEKTIFAKDKNSEALFDILRKEQQNDKVKSLLVHFEPLYEDQFYMVFVTERVRGCLPWIFTYYKMSPDIFTLGFCTLIQDLAHIAKNGYSGSVTPSNIVVTANGFWRVIGFGMGAQKTLKYMFEAPTPNYQGSSYTYDAQRDLSQALISIISVVIGIAPVLKSGFSDYDYVDFAQSTLGCKNVTFVYTGHCDQQISQLLAVDIFANPHLEQLSSLADEMKTAICSGMPVYDFMEAINKKVQYCQLFLDLSLYLAFNQDLPKMPVNYVQKITQICDYLVAMKQGGTLYYQFFEIVVFEPLARMLQYEELHARLIDTLIKLGNGCAEAVRLFLLFEPLMVACTLSNYRSKYPLQPNNSPFYCYYGVQFYPGLTLSYKNPFLLYYEKQNKADYMLPDFDPILAGTKPHARLDTCKTFYSNLDFFLNPYTGGRSHFHTINFLASQLSTGDSNSELLDNLAKSVNFLGDKNWCCAENMVMTEIHSRFIKQYKVKNDKKVILVDPFKPLNSFLVPYLHRIMSRSQYQSQVVACIECLTNCVDYFLDNEIAAEVLPALHSSMQNIEKYPKAMVAFSRFAQRCACRCTAKTVTKMFLPRVFNCMYSYEISKEELATLRKISSDLSDLVLKDVDQRLGVREELSYQVNEEVQEKECSELQWYEPDAVYQYPNLLEGILE